jgi:SSS family transporter
MKTGAVLAVILFYFLALFLVSALTAGRRKEVRGKDFFDGGRKSPWWIVAISMVGTSISGVTFVSVPGMVEASLFSYMQMVLGFVAGYVVIAYVLLPLYYRLDMTSIYGYLGERFGGRSRLSGSVLFLVSKYLGCGVRMYLTASILQLILFDALGVPFWANVAVTMLIVWGYTFRGGVKTLVWADMLQTLAMVGTVILCIWLIAKQMGFSFGTMCTAIKDSPMSRIWFFDDLNDKRFFWKQFLAGLFTTVAMTGLDQDMMQKNLSCRNLREARKNVLSYGVAFLPVNLLFLALGVLLYMMKASLQLDIPVADNLFPTIATQYMPPVVGILFVLGLVAAGFSSSGSALTALTSSMTLDILKADRRDGGRKLDKVRFRMHILNAVAMGLIICAFRAFGSQSVINAVYTIAGYTYGPLLGLFIYGIVSRRNVRDTIVPFICGVSPLITYVLAMNSERWFGGYQMGFENLLVNAAITMLLLFAISPTGSARRRS